ncbi:MAG: YlmC/YmxH family sporulation protein [Clostridia bacterium]|nr:YlmC/YmxH family sporulation protein [Clostridia bacterium]
MSLSELRTKDVISTQTGKNLGKVMDIEFDPCSGCVEALVVPGEFSLACVLRGEKNGLVIPWQHILRIGENVILVHLPEQECCPT